MFVEIDESSYRILDFITRCFGVQLADIKPERILLPEETATPYQILFEFDVYATARNPNAHAGFKDLEPMFKLYALSEGVHAGIDVSFGIGRVIGAQVEFRGNFKSIRHMVEFMAKFYKVYGTETGPTYDQTTEEMAKSLMISYAPHS